eukprot:TRINITY_DN490_c0_g1_i2.p1 TRINITY_DN490_c0_g1~~TRINITY_DN490_c0_g1_i2.p1  ORF type:complete len:213 (+),score=61.83 TRINITY_DN490_c0_g1_i2:230-868(+)
MRLFGKAKEAPLTPKDSIMKLRETLDTLEKREAHLEAKIRKEVADAKKYLQAKNKRAAMMCLKRKKTYESQIEKLSGARMTIETQVSAIEGASVTIQALTAMQHGAKTMKKLHQDMTVDQVDDIMDEITEQMTIAEELNTAISQPLGNDLIDEDELEAELDALEQENLDSQLLPLDNVATPSKLPSVPMSAPAKALVDEDAELRALEESMAI